LLSQIKSQTSLDFAFSHQLFAKNLFLAVYKPLGSIILIFGILFGTWIASVGATRNSQPGDFLYGFKLTAERMQVNLTMNDEKRTNLEIAFAERRLDEIKKTVSKATTENSQKNLEVTLKKYQESINNVKSNLAKLEVTDKESALKVANLLDEKTKTYVDILKGQQDQDSQLAANKETAEAITVSKSTADKALEVILTEFEIGNSGMRIDDVKNKIEARITDLETSLETDKGQIETISINKKIADEAAVASAAAKAMADKKALEEAAAAKALEDKKAEEEAAAKKEEAKTETPTTDTKSEDSVNNNANANVNADANSQPETQNINSSAEIKQDDQTVSQPAEVLPTINDIKDKPKEAAALLAKAKEFLKSGSVSQAFALVKQADDIATLIEKVIKANNQYLEAPAVPADSGDNQAEAIKIENKS